MIKKINKLKPAFFLCLCAATLFSAGCGAELKQEDEGTIVSDVAEETDSKAVTKRKEEATDEVSQKAVAQESEDVTAAYEEEDFYISNISDDIFDRIEGKSYSDDCTVPVEDLRYLHILHKDIEGKSHEGELICNRYIAQDLLEIFEELYKADYPIERVRLVDEYGADDETSMRDNNSSCFNFRFITGTQVVSMHGEGLAIDINPLYNPFHSGSSGITEPATALDYLNRDEDFDYKIEDDDICVRLFKEHGFDWGGDWTEPKDYQHFEKEL